LGVHTLVESNLEQVFCMYRRRIVLDEQQMRFLVVVRDGHDTVVRPYQVCNLDTALVLNRLIDMNYDVCHVHDL